VTRRVTQEGILARPRWILPAIVAGQLLATSIWFAANAVIGSLQDLWGIAGGEGTVTTAVQLGFIAGTLAYAVGGFADRFHPGNVFLVSASIGAAANAAVLIAPAEFSFVLAARFVAGFCLAGVYPVGMKIAASWYAGGLGRALGFLVGALVLGTASAHLLKGLGGAWDWRLVVAGTSVAALAGGLGRALGFLVGALVLGTASAHLLKGLGGAWDWRLVVAGTSVAALAGGVLVRLVPEGPHLARGGPVRFRGVLGAFRDRGFRASACGYFGHMWELYAFWAFVPVWAAAHGFAGSALSLTAFAVIAAGAIGCAGGGYLVARLGGGRVALGQLSVSGACCVLSPLLLHAPTPIFVAFAVLWGVTVVGDSPQFSALSASFAPRALVGSALTLVNCIGFSISIASLSLLEVLQFVVPPEWLLVPLALGPAVGLWAGRPLLRHRPAAA